jgi:hypothetical protein
MTSVLAPIYSARDSAITQRPTSTSLLCIDSEDRFRDYDQARILSGPGAPPQAVRSPYSFTITKNQSLMNGFFTRLGVTEVVFPWVIPNINLYTRGITFAYDAGAGDVFSTVVLEDGFYTPSAIASRMQTLIRAINPALAAFTMTYGVFTNLGTATATQKPIFEYASGNPAVTVSFFPLAGTVTIGGTPITYTAQRKQLFDLLGFATVNAAPVTIGDGTNTYCQTTRYIDIVCTQLTANQALKDTMSQTVARDVLCRVYVGDAQGVQSTTLPSSSTFCPPGCMPTTIFRDYSQAKQIQWIPNQPVPGYLQFDVYDDAGFPLKDYDDGFGNGANWSMTVLVSEN